MKRSIKQMTFLPTVSKSAINVTVAKIDGSLDSLVHLTRGRFPSAKANQGHLGATGKSDSLGECHVGRDWWSFAALRKIYENQMSSRFCASNQLESCASVE